MIFKNREQTAEQLSKALLEYKNNNVVVLALPRGGVVLGKTQKQNPFSHLPYFA